MKNNKEMITELGLLSELAYILLEKKKEEEKDNDCSVDMYSTNSN